MTSSEFVLSDSHLLSAQRRPPKVSQGGQRSVEATLVKACLPGVIAIIAGASWKAFEGGPAKALIALPAILLARLLGWALLPSRKRRQRWVAQVLQSSPWLVEPCRLTLANDSITLTRASVRTTIPRDAVLAVDVRSEVLRIYTAEGVCFADAETLRRDGMLEGLLALPSTLPTQA